jgi:DNA repair protein RadA/Sms
VIIIDSVQMVYNPAVDAFPGSLTQLRRCTAELVFMAKATGAAVLMVGHVTKDGILAGPRLLEHLVDAVLYFEGDRYHAHRVVRAVKNRFGSTLEIGLFEMTGQGLRPAPDGALVAASGADAPARPGTVVCPVLAGTRTLLVELQALTATGFPGAVKRKSSGLDASRLAMLIAVLEQHAGMRLADRDVFASAVGGVKVAEPAADLALLLAIAGAHHKRALARGTCVVGEVGLGGEVRAVSQLDARLHEAQRLGFARAILPKPPGRAQAQAFGKLELVHVATISQAIEQLG